MGRGVLFSRWVWDAAGCRFGPPNLTGGSLAPGRGQEGRKVRQGVGSGVPMGRGRGKVGPQWRLWERRLRKFYPDSVGHRIMGWRTRIRDTARRCDEGGVGRGVLFSRWVRDAAGRRFGPPNLTGGSLAPGRGQEGRKVGQGVGSGVRLRPGRGEIDLQWRLRERVLRKFYPDSTGHRIMGWRTRIRDTAHPPS